MFHTQLNSFVVKFHQLWQAGYNAHLNVDCHAGYAWCGLRVDLGAAPAAPRHQHQQVRPGSRRHAPSYRRRLEARAAARAAASNDAEKATEDATETAEEAGAIQEGAAEEAAAAQRVTEAIVAVGTGVAATAKKIAEEAEAKKKAEEAEKKKTDLVKAANEALARRNRTSTRLIDDPDARKKPDDWPGPRWWCDLLGTYKHYHGNMKFIISKELKYAISWEDEVITHSSFIRAFWTRIRQLPMNSVCSDPARSTMRHIFGSDVVKWSSLCDYLAPHLYFHSSRIGVINGKKLEAF